MAQSTEQADADTGDYQFSPDEFKNILDSRMQPAVQHFTDNATRFAALSKYDGFALAGPDPERLSADAAAAWNSCVSTIEIGRKQMVTLLAEVRDLLYEVLAEYERTEGANTSHFDSIGNEQNKSTTELRSSTDGQDASATRVGSVLSGEGSDGDH